MRVFLIGLATLAAVLTFAPGADAFGGGGRGRGGDSGAFGTVGRGGGGGGNAGQTGGNGNSKVFETTEPLAALAVGLGLLGARYLRRK